MHRHQNHQPLDDALAAGWRPCPSFRAADPSDRPRQAIGLYARGGRIAWLLELDDGRHVLEVGGNRIRHLLELWQQLAVHDAEGLRRAYLDAGEADRWAVLDLALERLTAQERAAWADRVRGRLANTGGRHE